MRRFLLAALLVLVTTITLSGQPAGAESGAEVATAQQALALPNLLTLFDNDGEPCTGVPNQLPGIFDFTAACQTHDACYVQGGDNTACDTAFRQDLLALCTAQHPQAFDPRRYLCQAFAVLYYTGVVLFGQLV